MINHYFSTNSPIGKLNIKLSQKGLTYLGLADFDNNNFTNQKNNTPLTSKMKKLKIEISKQLSDFFSGRRKKFNIPLDIQGTEFQLQVWKKLIEIPYGETCSYKDIAIALNKPNASRAVGTANSKNPISIIIPCHRVITSNGNLGGYSGGIQNKKFLLHLENSN